MSPHADTAVKPLPSASCMTFSAINSWNTLGLVLLQKYSQSSQCFVGAEWCLSVPVTNECGLSHCWQPPQGCDAIFSSSVCVYNYQCLSGPGASSTCLYSGTWNTHSYTLHTCCILYKQDRSELYTCICCCRWKTAMLEDRTNFHKWIFMTLKVSLLGFDVHHK